MNEDPVLLINLIHALDEIAVEQRIADSGAATNCATASASLRKWLDDEGLGPQIEPPR